MGTGEGEPSPASGGHWAYAMGAACREFWDGGGPPGFDNPIECIAALDALARQREAEVLSGGIATPAAHLSREAAQFLREVVQQTADALVAYRSSVGSTTRFLTIQRAEIGSYQLWADHGQLDGVPGESECLAIWKRELCPDAVAIASALLLAQGPEVEPRVRPKF